MESSLVDAGYFAKWIVPRPEWLAVARVREICSVSHCISTAPDGWIDHWLHNEFGWFNSAADALSAISVEKRASFRLFAYRIHHEFFRDGARHELVLPADLHPDPIPSTFQSLGFDAVSRSTPPAHPGCQPALSFECSPLSCNYMARELPANTCCLFDSLDTAIAAAVRFSIEKPEPGDYYVVEVLAQSDGGS